MEQPGNLKQIAKNVVGMLISVGIMAATPAAAVATADAHPSVWASAIAGLGLNLAASGLAALWKRDILRVGKDYQDQLANHDIVRLIQTSWGEASAATVAAYAKTYPKRDLTSLFAQRPESFLAIAEKLGPEEFAPKDINVTTIREAIQAARHSLTGPASEFSALQCTKDLRSGLVDALTETIAAKLPAGVDLPTDFKPFLEGQNPHLPDGLFGQLCSYVAFYLKSDARAQTAILHFTLQDIVDDLANAKQVQQRIENICTQINASVGDSQKVLLKTFETRIGNLSAQVQTQLNQAFNYLAAPPLDRPFATALTQGFADFTYRSSSRKPLIGRQTAQDSLVKFMGDPRQALWTVISGPAGTGKSRLAAEIINMVRTPSSDSKAVPPGLWRAGFLADRSWLQNKWLKWNLDADTLIVIDYAGQLDTAHLSGFLAGLNRPCELCNCLLRVILIDRLPPDSDLGLATKVMGGNDRGAEIRANRFATSAGTTNTDPLALAPVDDTSALQIAAAWAGLMWTPAAEKRILQALQDDPELGRPLFAALLGHAIGQDHLPPGELNPVTVAANALDRQFRMVGSSALWENAKKLLAAATAGAGIIDDDLFDEEIVDGLTGDPSLSEASREELRSNLRLLSGAAQRGVIPPLEPDFLGGLFVLQRLLGLPGKQAALRKADFLMSVAWQSGHRPGDFLVRLASDFVRRGEQVAIAIAKGGAHPDVSRVEELLVRLLLSTLKPVALKRGGTNFLLYAIYFASKAGNTKIAGELMDAMDAAYATPEIELDAGDLAEAWFAYALSGDLPAVMQRNAREALSRLRHIECAQSASVRETLAKALFNRATALGNAGELAKAGALVEELRGLHRDYPESAVREPLAKALVNRATALGNAGELGEAGALVEELRGLHRDYPESAVREQLAKALFNRAIDLGNAGELAESGALLEELRGLHRDYPESAVREQLAKALFNRAIDLGNAGELAESGALVEELRGLHRDYPESAVREQLAKALFNRGNDLGNAGELAESGALLEELRGLHRDYPESAVREQLAKALFNRAIDLGNAGELAESGALVEELRGLHRDYPESAVREPLAKALFNRAIDLGNAGELAESGALLEELRGLHRDYPESAVREQLAKALFNRATALGNAGELAKAGALVEELRGLHRDYPESAVREPLAKALVNLANNLGNAGELGEAGALVEELRGLHRDYPESAVREPLAKALVNRATALGNAGELGEAGALVEELRGLHRDYPESAVRERLAKALVSLAAFLGIAGQLVEGILLVDELGQIHRKYLELRIRDVLKAALSNWASFLINAGESAKGNALLAELRQLERDFPTS